LTRIESDGLLRDVFGDQLKPFVQRVGALSVIGHQLRPLRASNRSNGGWCFQVGLFADNLLNVEPEAARGLRQPTQNPTCRLFGFFDQERGPDIERD